MSTLSIIITLLLVLVGGGIELFIYLHTHGFHRTAAIWNLGTLNFWALGDRILIEEDEFKSGYECITCGGSGKTTCDNCGGKGERNGKKCGQCEGIRKVEHDAAMSKVSGSTTYLGSGQVICPTCNGKGGLIIAPDIAQRRPTTGRIVSCGHKVLTLKVGQSVMYSNFSGHVIDLARAGSTVTLRILHESEILCGMSGHLALTNLRGKSEIAQFTN